MRTWSVSGTALALCTRSSSLSIRTRTSMTLQQSNRCATRLCIIGFPACSLRAARQERTPAREVKLLKGVGEPGDAALIRVGRADLLRLGAVRERAHQPLRADVPGTGRAAQERDHLAVLRPRGR